MKLENIRKSEDAVVDERHPLQQFAEDYLRVPFNDIMSGGYSVEHVCTDPYTGEIVEIEKIFVDPKNAVKTLKERLSALKDLYDQYAWALDDEVVQVARSLELPDIFPDMDRARGVFARAVLAEYMSRPQEGKCEWNGTGQGSRWNSLGYLLARLWDVSYVGDGRSENSRNMPITDLAQLFGRKKWCLHNEIKRGGDRTAIYGKNNWKWKDKIDKLFENAENSDNFSTVDKK